MYPLKNILFPLLFVFFALNVLPIFDSNSTYQKKLNIKTFLFSSNNRAGTSDDMDISLPIFSFSVWPMVVKVVSVATIIEIFGISRYQMKDMDILFPLVPYYQILVKWPGHSQPAKLGSFG